MTAQRASCCPHSYPKVLSDPSTHTQDHAALANAIPESPVHTKKMEDAVEVKHERFRYYGPRQGAECECGEAFYPASGRHLDQLAAFAHHRFIVGAP